MKTETHPKFLAMHPRSTQETHKGGLGLRAVSTTVGVDHAGFDAEEVRSALGEDRYARLMSLIGQGAPYSGAVFACGHRTDQRGVEVHCIYAADLERFLEVIHAESKTDQPQRQ